MFSWHIKKKKGCETKWKILWSSLWACFFCFKKKNKKTKPEALVLENHDRFFLTCQSFWDWTCDVKSCCCSCLPSLRSQDLTVLSRPPVHSLVPSLEMSIQLAPSVWPWNCLKMLKEDMHILTLERAGSEHVYKILLFLSVPDTQPLKTTAM